MTQKRAQQGYSLPEILLVIGIIGSITIGAFIIFPIVQASQHVNKATNDAIMVSASAKQFFGDRSYSGLTTATAISAGILEDADTRTPWGNLDVTADSDGASFHVDFTGVPIDACQRLVVNMEPNAFAMRIGSTFVKDPEGTPPVAFDANEAIAACAEGSNTLSFWPHLN